MTRFHLPAGGTDDKSRRAIFSVELSVVGVSYSASDAENFGQTMCQAMRMGHSESEIAASAAQFNIQADDARYVLHGAEYHFCPSYY